MAPVLPDTNPKTVAGRLKPNLHAIPPAALIALGLAMEDGEGKYGLMNWRQNSVATSVYYDAALRHLLAWWDGENIAPDSRIHHLAHVMACCAIMIDAEIGNNLIDDRPMAGPAAGLIGHLHDQRIADAMRLIMASPPPPLNVEAAAARLEEIKGDDGVDYSGLSRPERQHGLFPFWNTRKRHQPKEIPMATELETIAAAVARSEASSEKTLALVTSLSAKIETIRASTTDDNTRAQLLALSVTLNAESDKVDAAQAPAAAELVDPAPPVADAPPPSTPAPAPTDSSTPSPVAAAPVADAAAPSPAPVAGEAPGSPGTSTPADPATAAPALAVGATPVDPES